MAGLIEKPPNQAHAIYRKITVYISAVAYIDIIPIRKR